MNYVLLTLLVSMAVTTATAEDQPEPVLTAMTFNLRYGTAKDEGHLWDDRKAAVLAVVTETHPDLLGLQESLDFQNEFLIQNLGAEYEFIGEGREGGIHGEYSSLLFRKDRFFLARAGRFWLSDTPEIMGSKSWASLPRMVTWADLVERGGQSRLLVLNTHFAHDSDTARKKSADLIRQRLPELAPEGAKILLMGDFNCVPGSEPYQILTGGDGLVLQDAFKTTGAAPKATFHDFKGPNKKGQPIDWILFSKGLVAIDYKVLDGQYVNTYPSDHFPVMAQFRIE